MSTGNNDTEEGSISNKAVLSITIVLLAILALIPFLQAIAESIQKEHSEPIVINETKKDYATLLSSLFGRVDQETPDDAIAYARNVNEYRIRIARGVKENNELIEALYVLVEGFPKKMEEGYRAEIANLEREAKQQKIAILPYIQNDAFLSDAVVEKYDLHPSIIENIVYRINNQENAKKLNRIKERSHDLRKEIALLYARVKTVMQQRDK